jgi:hypothetical protein
MPKRTQLIEGSGLNLAQRLRQGLQGCDGQGEGRQTHLRRCRRGNQRHRQEVAR